MERSPEIEGALRRFVRSFGEGDEAAVRALSSREPGRRAIGTDPREWSTGDDWDLMVAQVPEIAAVGGMRFQVVDADGYEEGSVGWAALNCLGQMSGSEPHPFRVTGVFHLESGHWQLVQVHFSIAVTNEEGLGVELITPLEEIVAAVQSDRPNLERSTAPDGTVTVLFTDIEDSTDLAERIGDAQWAELVRWHRADSTSAATAHRGFVVKSLGDGFMIAFSSATNAIHCAQDIRDRAAAGWHGHRINVRAGIHTGDAIRDLDDFFGHAVNVAARVAAIADGGEIVVTRVVRELVRGGPFTFDHLRSTPLKGIDDPVEIATVAPHLPADPRPDGPGARRRPRAPTDATPAIQLRQAPQ